MKIILPLHKVVSFCQAAQITFGESFNVVDSQAAQLLKTLCSPDFDLGDRIWQVIAEKIAGGDFRLFDRGEVHIQLGL